MAEIRVEKRKPVWPWILGLLLLIVAAGAIIFFTQTDDGEKIVSAKGESKGMAGGMAENSVRTNDSGTSALDDDDCIQGFSSFVSQTNTSTNEASFNNYAHNGLDYLSCSLEAILDEGNIDENDLERRQEKIFKTTKAIRSEQQSDPSQIKSVFTESADLLEAIQQRHYPNLQQNVQEVRSAVQQFSADQPTVQQKEAMEAFFEKVSETITAMNAQANKK